MPIKQNKLSKKWHSKSNKSKSKRTWQKLPNSQEKQLLNTTSRNKTVLVHKVHKVQQETSTKQQTVKSQGWVGSLVSQQIMWIKTRVKKIYMQNKDKYKNKLMLWRQRWLKIPSSCRVNQFWISRTVLELFFLKQYLKGTKITISMKLWIKIETRDSSKGVMMVCWCHRIGIFRREDLQRIRFLQCIRPCIQQVEAEDPSQDSYPGHLSTNQEMKTIWQKWESVARTTSSKPEQDQLLEL